MATLVSDTFTNTNGTLLPAHTPGTDYLGWGWGKIGSADWDIQGNQAQVSSTGSLAWCFAVINPGQKNIDVTITFTTPAGESAVGIVVHWKDSDNHWRIQNQTNGDTLHIYEVNGGGSTSRASAAATMSPSTTYTLRVVVNGNTIEAYWNGAGTPTTSYASASFLSEYPVIGMAAYVDAVTYTNKITFDSISATGNELSATYVEWSNNETAIGEHPVIKDDLLYVSQNDPSGADDGLAIYWLPDGTLLHHFNIAQDIAAAPAITSTGSIFIWGAGGYIYEFNHYGRQNQASSGHGSVDWEALVLDTVNSRLLVPAGGVLVARPTSNITTNAWTSSAAMPTTNYRQVGPPLIHGNYVYFLDTNAVLWKLNLSDGTTAGSLDLSASVIDSSYAQIIYDAARDDVYATDDDGRTVYSVDVSTGTLSVNWSVTLGTAGEEIKRGPAYANNVLYVPVTEAPASPDHRRTKIYALDVTNNGATLWTNPTAYDNDAHVSNLLTDGTYVYGATYDYFDGSYTKLLVINASNGSLVTTFDLDTGTSSAIPVARGGYLYVGLWNDQGIQAIQVRTGGGTGDFPWKADSDFTGYIGSFMSGDVIGVSSYQPRAGVAVGGVFMV